MTRARRAVLFVGMLIALVAGGRLLMPFSAGRVGTGRDGPTSCGVVAAEASRDASRACTVAARRRVTSVGVVVGLDVIGVAGGLLILRPEGSRSR